MAVNDAFAKSVDDLGDTSDLVVDGSGAGTGAVEVQEIVGDSNADIKREFDPDGDGTYEISVIIDQYSSRFHSQLNAFLVSQSQNVRLVVTNTSGSANDYGVTGLEVND